MWWPESAYWAAALLLIVVPVLGLGLCLYALRAYLLTDARYWLGVILLIVTFFWRPFVREGRILAQIDWTFATLHFAQVYRQAMLLVEPPLWNPFLGGGVPGLGNPLFPALYPLSPLFLLGEPASSSAFLIAHVCAGAVGMYLLGRTLGYGPAPAVVAALVFGLNEWVLRRLHPEIAASYALGYMWLPWSLALLEQARRARSAWPHGALAGLPLSWVLFIQPNQFVYGAILIALWTTLRVVGDESPRWRDVIPGIRAAGAAAVAGAVAALPELWPALQQTALSFPGDRALATAGGWRAEAVAPAELLRLVVPTGHRPFAKPFTPGYVGAAAALLSLAALRVRRRAAFLWLLLLAGALFWLATPLDALIRVAIPGLDRVTRLPPALTLLLVPLSLLAAEGSSWLASTLRTSPHLLPLVLAGAIFTEQAAYVGWLLPSLSERLPEHLVSTPDTLPPGELRDFPHLLALSAPDESDASLLRLACYPQPYGGLCPPYAFPTFQMSLYSMAIRTYMAHPPRHFLGTQYLFEGGLAAANRILDAAAVSYVVSAHEEPSLGELVREGRWPTAREHLDEGVKIHLRPLGENWNGQYWLYRRPTALDTVTFVPRGVMLLGNSSADAAGLAILTAESFDPRRVAVLWGAAEVVGERVLLVDLTTEAWPEPGLRDRSDVPGRYSLEVIPQAARIRAFLDESTPLGAAGLEVSRLSPSRLRIRGRFPSKGFVVVSETYFPGWAARVDGVRTTLLRANYSFMAVPVEPGDRTVELQYQPWGFLAGLGGVTSLVALLAFAVRRPGRAQWGPRASLRAASPALDHDAD